MKYISCCQIKLFAVLFLFWVTTIHAQPGYYNSMFKHAKDSLVELLNKHKNADTTRINLLCSSGTSTFLSEKKEVINYWHEAINLAQIKVYKR